MKRKLIETLKAARRTNVPIDVSNKVMAAISKTAKKKKHLFYLLPVTGIILALIIFSLTSPPPAPPVNQINSGAEKEIIYIKHHPRTFSPYTNPYNKIDLIKLWKGGCEKSCQNLFES